MKMIEANISNISPSTHDGGQLLVDFPTRCRTERRNKSVRFASHVSELSVRSTLTMISDKQELWYASRDIQEFRLERDQDAAALARTLLAPSAEDLKEGGLIVSKATGLERVVNPIERRRAQKTMILHRRAVISLQDKIQGDDDLRRLSESFSQASLARARTLAVHWVALDKK